MEESQDERKNAASAVLGKRLIRSVCCFVGIASVLFFAMPLQTLAITPTTFPDTSLTQCPAGYTLDYFYYYEDIPELRGDSWCGAAQADLDYANATDPNRWRIPYLLDACTPGVNWYYSHALQGGTRFHSSAYRGINMVCTALPATIALIAPGLISPGASIPVTAIVTQNGQPAAGVGVSAVAPLQPLQGSFSCGATTDAAGQASCTYTAPARQSTGPLTETLTATCDTCVSPASTAVTVLSLQTSSMCPRQDGVAVGKPIYPATGEERMDVTDYAEAGPHPLVLSRTYLARPGIGASGAPTLSASWGFNIGAVAVNNGLGSAIVSFGGGQDVQAFTGNQTYVSGVVGNTSAGIPYGLSFVAQWTSTNNGDTLTATPAEPANANSAVADWTYRRASDGSTWYFGANGQVQTVTERNGWVMHYSYDANGRISQITNHFGRSLAFTYDASGLLTTVTLPGGQTIGYDYDTAAGTPRLLGVHYPDSTSKGYGYTHNSFPTALTQVIDETQQVLATVTYDAQGRATSSSRSGGVELYSVSYGSSGSATVTDPLGTQRGYSYGFNSGKLAVTSADKPSGTGLDSAASRTQNTLGLIDTETDFLGRQSLFTWDSTRRLLIGSTHAASTPLSQATTNQWHPTMALQAVVAEPGRRTTYVYNGQPDPFNGGAVASCAPPSAVLPGGAPIAVLCKRVEQATTDASGSQGLSAALQPGVAARIWSWGYNADGQMLVATDPRGNSTQRTYYADTTATHARGDLQSATNALGHATQFTDYDAKGNLLQSVDANGVATVYAYDARSRLKSQSIAGQATSYTYDVTGQLTRITLPDASWIGYEYDAAQRRTATLDSQGNRIEVTLDNQGNVTAQSVKDPGGALRRALGQVIDALGRVQQISGGV